MSTPETPRKPRRKPGVQPLWNAHYLDYKRRVKRPSGWTINADGVEVPKGKRWQVRYNDPDGVQKYESFAEGEKAQALARHKQLTIELDTGTHIDRRKSETLFSEVAETWTASLIGKAASTRDNYGRMLRNHVMPHWGSREVGSITHGDVLRWVADLEGSMAPATLHRCYQVLSGVLQVAVLDGLRRDNPADRVKLPPVGPSKDRYLESGEVDRLARASDYLAGLRADVTRKGRDRDAEKSGETLPRNPQGHRIIPDAPPSMDGVLIRFLAGSGLRIGEATALRVRNVDLGDMPRIHVREAHGTATGGKPVVGLPKGRKVRTVDISPELAALLREHVAGKSADELVFTGPTGAPIRRNLWNRRALAEAATLADLAPLSAHDLRHTFGSLAASAGVPIQVVSEWLGHADIKITAKVYVGLFAEDRQAHAALLGARMARAK